VRAIGLERTLAAAASSLDRDPDIDDSFLAGVAAAPSVDPDANTMLLPGTHVVGKYRIEARIGQGGMGTVYRATDTRLQRPVAIKIHHSLTTRVERLRREARMLARLSHPNVVTVLEVGTHEGMVFVAMEYVDGGNARSWLHRQPRSWQQIVELYRQAGRGLAAAHALGIVHRDFKPDNVLVGVDGRARVADFGLAGHAIDSEHDVDQTLEATGASMRIAANEERAAFATEAGVMVGTPAYVAPEQIASSRVDARADQFGFCAALFEALYGSLPFPGSSAQEVVARILGGELAHPTNHKHAPAWVLVALERGLARDPARRFTNMDALLAALAPRPRSRRWLPVVGLAIAGSVLVASPWSGEPPPRGCEDESQDTAWAQRRSELARGVERLEDATASEAWTLLDRRLGARIDDWSVTRTAVCAAGDEDREADARRRERQLACLADGADAIDALLAELEPARSPLIHAAGLAERLPEAARCIAVAPSSVAAPPADVAADVEALRGVLATANTRLHLGLAASASALVEVVVARAQQLGYPPMIADALNVRARARATLGRTEEALADARATYEEAARVDYDQGMSHGADLLASLALERYELDEALRWNDEARSHIKRPLEDAWLIVTLIAREAEIRAARGEPDAGLALLDQADAFAAEAGLAPDITSIVHTTRGAIAQARGDYGGAIAEYERARDGYTIALGRWHHQVVATWIDIAVAYHEADNYLEARNAYLRALEIHEALGENPRVAIELELGIAAMDDMLGDGEAALRRFDQAEAMLDASRIDDQLLVTSISDGRGVILLGLGRSDQAVVELQRTLELSEQLYGAQHDELRRVLSNLALAARQAGRLDEAEGYLQRALRIQSSMQNADEQSAALRHAYGFLLIDRGRIDDAALQFERAAEIIAHTGGDDAPGMGWVEWGRGLVALARDQPEQAVRSLERADALWAEGGLPPEDRADLHLDVARARWEAGDRAGALEIARETSAAVPGDAPLRAWLATHHD
jgi:eukaryotic-like serine/threonine-protein kinase